MIQCNFVDRYLQTKQCDITSHNAIASIFIAVKTADLVKYTDVYETSKLINSKKLSPDRELTVPHIVMKFMHFMGPVGLLPCSQDCYLFLTSGI
jgi:hypothetical protein